MGANGHHRVDGIGSLADTLAFDYVSSCQNRGQRVLNNLLKQEAGTGATTRGQGHVLTDGTGHIFVCCRRGARRRGRLSAPAAAAADDADDAADDAAAAAAAGGWGSEGAGRVEKKEEQQ